MSLFDYLFDSEWRQRSDIESLRQERYRSNRLVNRHRRKALELDGRVKELEDDLAELALFNATLLRMLTSKGVCTNDEFAGLLKSVDAEDGRIDGRRAPPACPNCGHERPAGSACAQCGQAP